MEQVFVIRNLTTGQYWNGTYFGSDYISIFNYKESARAELTIIKSAGNYLIEPIYVA